MSSIGPTGIQGVQGIQGVTGPQGLPGPAGIQGPDGIQGPVGPQGLRGQDGPQGILGSTGPQGIIGPTGAQGVPGQQGIQGMQGIQGPASGLTGPTGSSSLWITNAGNMYYSPTGNTGRVGINNANPAYTLDVSGTLNVVGTANFNTITSISGSIDNFNVNKISYLCNISEKLITVAVSATPNRYHLDFSQSSVFYLSSAPTANMTFYIYNIPSVIDASHSYVLSVIYKGTSANFYGSSVNITSTNTPGSGTPASITPKFTNTPSVASITNSQLIVQQITYIYLGTSGFVISNVNGFGA